MAGRPRGAALALLLIVGAPALSGGAAMAQRLGAELKRPRLEADADTNDPQVYFQFATRALEERPGDAAEGFYWAARLEPASAEALYGLRIARLMRNRTTLTRYMEGGRRAREHAEMRAIDSLQLRALWLNPFLYGKYDRTLLVHHARMMLRGSDAKATRFEIERTIDEWFAAAPPPVRAWLAYSEGRIQAAIGLYQQSIERWPNVTGLRIEKARALTIQGDLPAAIAEFDRALAEYRKRETGDEDAVVFYNSKASLHHSVAILWARLGLIDSARTALGRAITDDLAYFPAHLELSSLALVDGDTAAAVQELALAAEIATGEPYVQSLYGSTLVALGREPEAIAPLERAIALEPSWAAPHFSLAEALEVTGDLARAKSSYEQYIARATRRDPRRAEAAQRLSVLVPAETR